VIWHDLTKRTMRQLVDGTVLSCEGGCGWRPQWRVVAWLRLPSSMASVGSGDDGDWQRD
jgi:hypothetical protein